MQRVMQAYFNTTATTTSPGDVIIMLYDGAISFLERAKQKIIEKDYAQKGILISKAMDVIGELDGSLNIDKGGNLAENLHSLYFFCNTHLLQANLKMDTEKIDKVITILTDLRDAFATIVNTPEAVQAAQNNAMSQRAQAPQVRMPVSSAPAPSSIGSARASSLYSKNIQAFTASQNPAGRASTPAGVTPDQAGTSPVTDSPMEASMQPSTTVPIQASVPTPTGAPVQASTAPTGASPAMPTQPKTSHGVPLEAANINKTTTSAPAQTVETQETATLAPPPSRLESRFQGAALYKKFAQN